VQGNDRDSASDAEDGGAAVNAAPNNSMEMEVTFTPGLEQLGKKILEQQRDKKKQKEGETVWEAYMRRKRWVLASLGWAGDCCSFRMSPCCACHDARADPNSTSQPVHGGFLWGSMRM
jgi:hypothetical protein